MLSEEQIINHVSIFLTDLEKETLYQIILKIKKKGNMFYSYFHLDFYYGDLCFRNAESYEYNRKDKKITFIVAKFDNNGKIGEIELLPFKLIDLKVGDKFDKRELHKHKETNKYAYNKPMVEVVEINGDEMKVRYDYIHYKKPYSKFETLSKKECEFNLYRGKFEKYITK